MPDCHVIETQLKPYAAYSSSSKGRRYFESDLCPTWKEELFIGDIGNYSFGSLFQHDRDRIVHCEAFRRLEYKTQVFLNDQGDLFRTRLTHSLEVAQIARSLSRNLGLNEDLAEAISLAHDLGHTPFGHAGQDALNQCMQDYGGFEHNLHGLRIVDELEERYPQFNGLNLTFETREGILKHCQFKDALMLGEVGERFIKNTQPSLEAQIANFADEIAYSCHDIEDGLRAGFLTLDQLKTVEIWSYYDAIARTRFPFCSLKRHIYEVVQMITNALIADLTVFTASRLSILKINNIEDVRLSQPIVSYSTLMLPQIVELKKFLKKNLYTHFKVIRIANKLKKIITRLFDAFMEDNRLLPSKYQSKVSDQEQARLISYYIAGMTDRYAIKEYKRVFCIEEIF